MVKSFLFRHNLVDEEIESRRYLLPASLPRGRSCDGKSLTHERANARIVFSQFRQRRGQDTGFAGCVAKHLNDNMNKSNALIFFS
jgi:hypothetical protein